MKLRAALSGLALGALAAALLPVAGLLPPGTTAGHWVEGWHRLAARQSLTLRALTVIPPPMGDPAMARRAAGHYALVCAQCHGSPAAPPARLAEDISPRPPPLAEGHWRPPARDFVAIRGGISRTAMPAWPAPMRQDEIWEMVAFLRLLPRLSAADYAALAGQGRCRDCHGAGGEGRDGIPRLDIHTPDYLTRALRAYRDGARHSGPMAAAARRLDDAAIAGLAAGFGRAVAAPLAPDAPPLALHGDRARDIPACLSCHGPDARPAHPRLAGQDARYIARQLRLYAAEEPHRLGNEAQTMRRIASALTEPEIEALAAWFAAAQP